MYLVGVYTKRNSEWQKGGESIKGLAIVLVHRPMSQGEPLVDLYHLYIYGRLSPLTSYLDHILDAVVA